MSRQKQVKAPASGEKHIIGVLYGFRTLMVLTVCHFHIWQQSWLPQYFTILGIQMNMDYLARAGYLFVDGMLLLSGFLLYLPYAMQKTEGASVPNVKRFYANRLIRILPSYVFSILVMLFFVALPEGRYGTGSALTKDLATHFTFTFTFWRETYLYTPLGGALWTVAVEMQFYLIFPLLARAMQKKPAITLTGMALAGFAYRWAVYTQAQDTSMLINQMPGFLDVYALGMLGAMGYARWRVWLKQQKGSTKQWSAWGAAVVFGLSCWGVDMLLRHQAKTGVQGAEVLRLSQLVVRFPLGICLLGVILGASGMPRFLQKLLDNRLMRFFAVISFNLYIWHQSIAVLVVKHWFPATLHGDLPLQWACTALCFSLAILAAMSATFGVEQPAARLANRMIEKHRRKRLS